MSETLILEERTGPCATFTFNRPDARNPLSWPLVEELAAKLKATIDDDSVRGVVLTGSGKAFSAGGDLKAQAERVNWTLPQRVSRTEEFVKVVGSIWNYPKPMIAAVNGVAAGAGAGIALMCDIRFVAEGARFSLPFPKVGLGPDYAVSWTLPRLIGEGAAARVMYTGGEVSAEDAVRLGLAEQLCAPDTLLADARALVDQIAEVAPFGVHLAKAGIRRSPTLSFEEALSAEFDRQNLAMGTEDYRGAIAAFADKRAPEFSNR